MKEDNSPECLTCIGGGAHGFLVPNSLYGLHHYAEDGLSTYTRTNFILKGAEHTFFMWDELSEDAALRLVSRHVGIEE